MIGENYMVIGQDEMRRAMAMYMNEAFGIGKESIVIEKVRQRKFGNQRMFEIKLKGIEVEEIKPNP